MIDASESAKGPCGADIDGDGEIDSILQAEVKAVHLLLDRLLEVEAQTVGTAFELSLLRFGDSADVLAPSTPLTGAGVKRLRMSLDSVKSNDSVKFTNYPAALDRALEAFRATEKSGPSIIIFLTDGVPVDGKQGYIRGIPIQASLDAAARAGRSHGWVGADVQVWQPFDH